MRAPVPDTSPGGGPGAAGTAGSVPGVGAVPPQLAAILVPLTGSSRTRSGEGAPAAARDAAPVADMTWPPLESDIDAVEVIDLDAARHEAPPAVRPPSGRPAGVAAFSRPAPTPVSSETGQPVPAGATDTGGALAWPPPAEDIDAIAMIDLEAPAATHGAVALAPFELPAPAPVTVPGVSAPPATSRAVPAPRAWGRTAAGAVLVAVVAAGVGYVVTQRGTSGPVSQPATLDGAAAAAPRPVEPRAEAPAALPSTPVDAPGDTAAEPAAPAPASLAPSSSTAATLAESRRLLARGDRAGALRLAMSAGNDPDASRLVASVLRGAASAAEGARGATLSRVANGDTLESFRLARTQETSAVALWRQGQFDRALEQFALATRGYTAVEAPPTARPVVPAGTSGRAAEASASGGARDPVSAAEAVVPVAAPSTVVDAGGPATAREARPTPTLAPPSAPEPRPAAVVRNDDAGVRRTIEAYRSAFDRLDAAAASAVVPSLDAKALARAFNGLASQRLDFERCDVAVDASASTARATCVGRAASVPKVGSSKPRVDPRRWSFALERRGDQWQITNAQVAQR